MIDLDAYHHDGFTVVQAREVLTLKAGLSAALVVRALAALEKEPIFRADMAQLRKCESISQIVDHVVSRETANEVSGRLYRVFAATPELVAAIADPTVLGWVRSLGLVAPVAGTMPILRLDRSGDEWYRTPAHQDWWFSLLSPNSVTVWFTIGPLDDEMGLLEVAPGSHKAGLIEFRDTEIGSNPFRTAEDWPDTKFQPIPLVEDAVLIFSQFLVHRSGVNRSPRTRMSIQLRYNDIATMGRAETSYSIKHSDYVLKAQNRLVLGR